MYVLDRLQNAQKNWEIKLPLYHRGHLSLYPGTTVHLAPFLSDSRSPRRLPEILGSTIHRNSWRSVFRIAISLYDSPGVLHETVRSIARHGGNVLHLDSTSSEQESIHQVEAVVDFVSLLTDERKDQSVCEEIEGLLLTDCSPHVFEDEESKIKVSVRPIGSLRRLSRMLDRVRLSGTDSLVQSTKISVDGRFEIKGGLKDLLEQGTSDGNIGIGLPFRYLVTSDTKERIFRVVLVPGEDFVVWCSIRHDDRPGAVAAITGAIKQQGITILCALNRVQIHQGVNWFEMIVSKTEWGPQRHSGSLPTEQVEKILEGKELSKYNPEIFFSRSKADRSMRTKQAVPIRRQVRILRRQVAVEDWLKTSEQRMDAVVDKHEKRILQIGLRKVREATGRLVPTVFLSLEFSKVNRARIQVVRDCGQELGVRIDVVESARREHVVWHELVDRISRATHFISIWTPTEKSPETDNRPSPWCLWELGVANALRKPFAVAIQEGTNMLDYGKIHGGRVYFPFHDEAEFKKKIFDLLSEIIEGKLT